MDRVFWLGLAVNEPYDWGSRGLSPEDGARLFRDINRLLAEVARLKAELEQAHEAKREIYKALQISNAREVSARAEEREACALIAGSSPVSPHGKTHAEHLAAQSYSVAIATAIRARSTP